ncbi:hypothetical protein WJX74_003835 [Apatococcus lobatus]|uniref:F-box domain-containing protein n=1 Tax=Apatococcus lobatus TaxID=904363 RepID=A0AAW1RH98_9CHLO
MQHRNGAGGWPLPLELTKLILAPLNLRDRLALASACRFLRTACDPPDCWRTCKLDSLAEFAGSQQHESSMGLLAASLGDVASSSNPNLERAQRSFKQCCDSTPVCCSGRLQGMAGALRIESH